MGKDIRNRNFTDIICAIIFIGYSIFMAYLLIYGWSKGDTNNIAQPFDFDKRPCGRDAQLDYQFLYINNPLSGEILKEGICIKKCPKSSSEVIECLPTT